MLYTCKKCNFVNEVTVKPRSIPENKYYWSIVVGAISDATGHTPQETHEILKFKFLRAVTGKFEFIRSTTDLSTVEFEKYLSEIRVFAAQELNCYIPEPNSPPI